MYVYAFNVNSIQLKKPITLNLYIHREMLDGCLLATICGWGKEDLPVMYQLLCSERTLTRKTERKKYTTARNMSLY